MLLKKRLFAPLAAMLLCLTFFTQGCATPTVDLQDVLLNRLTTDRLELGLVLNLVNPNSVALPLDTVDWDLRLFRNPFADGTARFGRQIPARGNSRVEVPIGIRFAEAAMAVTRVVQNRQIPWQLAGAVNFRLPTGPFSIDFQNAGQWRNPLVR